MRRRRTVWIILSAAVTALVVAGVIVWLNATPYSETVNQCAKALTAQSKAGGKGKPDACDGVKPDDYDALVVSNAIDGMSKEDRDLLDYYDDGSIDGSVG